MRRAFGSACLLSLLLAGSPADAAIKKYLFRNTPITQSPNSQPNPDFVKFAAPNVPGGVFLVDPSTPGSPRLRKLIDVGDGTTTVIVPGLVVQIFLSINGREGPGINELLYGRQPPAFTGTGNVTGGSTIKWGTITGWTNTGNFWCNGNPGVICTLGGFQDEATTEPPFYSEFYDIGTWFFHTTGFTSTPYVKSYFTTDFGNNMYWYHGIAFQDATVPALEVLGLLAAGGSLVTAGTLALRRRGRRP